MVGAPDRIIKQGICGRHHDLARPEFADGRAGDILLEAKPRALPLNLEMVDRRPEGGQAYLPMSPDFFLVVVAEDQGDAPGPLPAFVAIAGRGINLRRGAWHRVLPPLSVHGLFAVLDRIVPGEKLADH